MGLPGPTPEDRRLSRRRQHVYDRAFVESLTPDQLMDASGGESQYPITVELLEAFREVYDTDPILPPLLGRIIGTPMLGEDVVEWIARFAEERGDRDLWLIAVTDANADLERALTAPPMAMNAHSPHCFVWKHSKRTGHLWSEEQWRKYQGVLEESPMERARFATMDELLKEVIG